MSTSLMLQERTSLHRRMLSEGILGYRVAKDGRVTSTVNVADSTSKGSTRVAAAFAEELAATHQLAIGPAHGAEPGKAFELLVKNYLFRCFGILGAEYVVSTQPIESFAQYRHLGALRQLVAQNEELKIQIGSGYVIRPDVTVSRLPIADVDFGENIIIGGEGLAHSTFVREANSAIGPDQRLLHASVSCKWTLRSDRAQNARTEALNLIRYRKGRTPAIVVVTAEPMPSRLASLADGTGDIDRVYHVGLYELERAVQCLADENAAMAHWPADLKRMVRGLRVADISDLPFDLLM